MHSRIVFRGSLLENAYQHQPQSMSQMPIYAMQMVPDLPNAYPHMWPERIPNWPNRQPGEMHGKMDR